MQKITIKPTHRQYPSLLKQIPDPPAILRLLGNPEVLTPPSIAIVGTRKYTEYGEEITRQIIRDLSVLDISITSGLARGIDTIAHQAAIENGLPTIAVLGNGINTIYPPQNQSLFKHIANSEQGLIISEFPDDAPPLKYNFLQRNRIIAALSIATIVIEAGERSGAINTAKHALNFSREIFTIPGDIHREKSLGPLRLIQRGAAYPIASAQEVIDILRQQPHLMPENRATSTSRATSPHATSMSRATNPNTTTSCTPSPCINPPSTSPTLSLTPAQQKILATLNRYRGKTPDKIASIIGKEKSQKSPAQQFPGQPQISPQQILAELTYLEMHNLIKNKNGKYLIR